MEESGIQAAAQFGFSMQDYLEKGLGTVARKTRIEYKQPALLGDTVEITTYLSDPRPIRATRHFIIPPPIRPGPARPGICAVGLHRSEHRPPHPDARRAAGQGLSPISRKRIRKTL